MIARKALGLVGNFVFAMLHRDRCLTEVLAALVTFSVGVLASRTQHALSIRDAMAGFRDMPVPEVWVMIVAPPGMWRAVRYALCRDCLGRFVPFAVMSSLYALSIASLVFALDNWVFWTLLALLLGITQGYTVVVERRDLRWGCALIGSFFWVSFALSVTVNAEAPTPLGVVTI